MSVPILARKTINKMGGVLNESVADTSMDFGRKMLAKFGWSEGKGLGKNMDGMQSHIRVKQRAENLGLGAQGEAEANAPAYAPPQPIEPRAKRRRREESSSGSDDSDSSADDESEALVKQRLAGSGVLPGMSDEQLFKLCGGARLGMRARGSQGGKQARMAEADAAYLAKFAKGSAAIPPTPASTTPPPPATYDSHNSTPPPVKGGETATEDRKAVRKAEKKAALKAERKAARKAAKKAARKAEKKASRKAELSR